MKMRHHLLLLFFSLVPQGCGFPPLIVDKEDSAELITDRDGDGWMPCDAQAQAAQLPCDCRDDNPNHHPDMADVCDGQDEDCDGDVDEGLPVATYAVDLDGDGYGSDSPLDRFQDCKDPGAGFVPFQEGAPLDCNDDNGDVNPGHSERGDELCDGLDQNCDGEDACEDSDGDGYTDDDVEECSPFDPTIPGAEIPGDEIDQDCNGWEECYKDVDGDGYRTEELITYPEGERSPDQDGDCDDEGEAERQLLLDCDDSNASIHRYAQEMPGDGVDQNCDGYELCYPDMDGDGYGQEALPELSVQGDLTCASVGLAPLQPLGFDCDDTNPNRHPGNHEEVADQVDGDCDGKEICFADLDGDGERPDGRSTVVSSDRDCTDMGEALGSDRMGDCDDERPGTFVGAEELCDGLDNDCDQRIDEGLVRTNWYVDMDGDGFGDEAGPVSLCTRPSDHHTQVRGDCDDADPEIHPGSDEGPMSDDLDRDCDGRVDDDGIYCVGYENCREKYCEDEDCSDWTLEDLFDDHGESESRAWLGPGSYPACDVYFGVRDFLLVSTHGPEFTQLVHDCAGADSGRDDKPAFWLDYDRLGVSGFALVDGRDSEAGEAPFFSIDARGAILSDLQVQPNPLREVFFLLDPTYYEVVVDGSLLRDTFIPLDLELGGSLIISDSQQSGLLNLETVWDDALEARDFIGARILIDGLEGLPGSSLEVDVDSTFLTLRDINFYGEGSQLHVDLTTDIHEINKIGYLKISRSTFLDLAEMTINVEGCDFDMEDGSFRNIKEMKVSVRGGSSVLSDLSLDHVASDNDETFKVALNEGDTFEMRNVQVVGQSDDFLDLNVEEYGVGNEATFNNVLLVDSTLDYFLNFGGSNDLPFHIRASHMTFNNVVSTELLELDSNTTLSLEHSIFSNVVGALSLEIEDADDSSGYLHVDCAALALWDVRDDADEGPLAPRSSWAYLLSHCPDQVAVVDPGYVRLVNAGESSFAPYHLAPSSPLKGPTYASVCEGELDCQPELGAFGGLGSTTGFYDDFDRDGIYDGWERHYGLRPELSDDAGGDYDGDGRSNFQEFLDNTSPLEADTP